MTRYLLACLLLASCGHARQLPPPASPDALMQGATLDTGGAQPDDRGTEQPLWPGVPRVLVVQTLEAPPDPTPAPPSAARELCGAWWQAWLRDRETEHGLGEAGWVDVARPPAAASDAWWATWLAQERDRCASAEPEGEGVVADWLGY